MTRSAAFVAAFLVTIGRPAWWVMALATFLVRGGIVVVFLPIVILPSALALSNLFGPLLIPLALGRVEPALVIGPAVVTALLLICLVGGGRVAAGIDAALVGEAAAAAIDEGVAGRGPESEPEPAPDQAADEPALSESAVAWRVLAVRLIALLPLALALGIGVARIVEVTYAQLTRPADVATPLVVRVAGEVVSHLGLIVLAWAIGEIVGGVAIRHVVLGRRGHGRSIALAVRTTASRPLSWAIPWLATTTLLFVVMGGALAAAALAWSRAVDALADRFVDPLLTLGVMLVFVAVWLAAMFLGGVILAVRSASQTFEYVRLEALQRVRIGAPAPDPVSPGGGTFGASPRGRTGDWSPNDDGGSL